MTKNDEGESGKGREIEGGGRIDRSSRGKFSFAWMVFFFKHAILKHISFVRWFSSSGILIKREWRAKGKNARIPRLIDITATTQDWAHTQVRARRKRSGNDRGSFVAIFNEFSSNSSYLYNKLSPFDPNQSIKRNLVFFYRSRNIYLSFDLIDWNRFLTLPFFSIKKERRKK